MSLLCGPWCVGNRIPREMMHKVPTSLLHSLEGMSDLDWNSLLKLQSQDGSFLFSPSSTAFALMQTKDQNCHDYLNQIVQRFNGGGISLLLLNIEFLGPSRDHKFAHNYSHPHCIIFIYNFLMYHVIISSLDVFYIVCLF